MGKNWKSLTVMNLQDSTFIWLRDRSMNTHDRVRGMHNFIPILWKLELT